MPQHGSGSAQDCEASVPSSISPDIWVWPSIPSGCAQAHTGEVSTASIACGVLGVGGNKGAVAVSFSLHRRRIAFVCSHFAAHQVRRAAPASRQAIDISGGLLPLRSDSVYHKAHVRPCVSTAVLACHLCSYHAASCKARLYLPAQLVVNLSSDGTYTSHTI